MGTSLSAYAVARPAVSVALVSGALYEGNGATFRISLNKPWVAAVTVAYATSNGTASAGTDYTSTSGSATIVVGDVFADIVVPTTLRAGAQASRTFMFTISGAEDEDGDTLTITDASDTATILDTQETPTLPTLSVAAVAPADEGDPLTFRVTSDLPFVEDVTFSYATSNGTAIAGTDYTSVSDLGTIPAESLTTDIVVATTERAGHQGARTFSLTISAAETASEEPVTITQATATGTIAETEPLSGGEEHDYFDALIARSDYVTGLSFRPLAGEPKFYASGIHTGKVNPYYASQLAKPSGGGYSYSNAIPPSVTYAPGADTDAQAQDAGRVVIPKWATLSTATLGADLSPSDTTINLGTSSSYDNGTSFLVDSEIITITAGKPKASPTTSCVRGQFGTTAATHTTGLALHTSTNSLENQVRLALNTTAGESYFYTWDTYFTNSYLRNPALGETADAWLLNHKAYQFTSRSTAGTIWQEPATRFTSSNNAPSPNPSFDNTIHVAEADWRSYMTLSSNTVFNPATPNAHPVTVTKEYPTRPMEEMVLMHPGRWFRWMVHMEHRIDDYDLLNVWVADEVQDPVQILVDLPVKAWQPSITNGTVKAWWLELNTSDNEVYRRDDRDLVMYIRNFVALNVAIEDIGALLVKPVGGA